MDTFESLFAHQIQEEHAGVSSCFDLDTILDFQSPPQDTFVAIPLDPINNGPQNASPFPTVPGFSPQAIGLPEPEVLVATLPALQSPNTYMAPISQIPSTATIIPAAATDKTISTIESGFLEITDDDLKAFMQTLDQTPMLCTEIIQPFPIQNVAQPLAPHGPTFPVDVGHQDWNNHFFSGTLQPASLTVRPPSIFLPPNMPSVTQASSPTSQLASSSSSKPSQPKVSKRKKVAPSGPSPKSPRSSRDANFLKRKAMIQERHRLRKLSFQEQHPVHRISLDVTDISQNGFTSAQLLQFLSTETALLQS